VLWQEFFPERRSGNKGAWTLLSAILENLRGATNKKALDEAGRFYVRRLHRWVFDRCGQECLRSLGPPLERDEAQPDHYPQADLGSNGRPFWLEAQRASVL